MQQRTILKLLRDLCLTLPAVTETVKWGNPTFEAGKKMFAVLDRYDGKLCIAFRASPDRYAEMLKDTRFFPAPYAAKHGWICLRAESKLDRNELSALLKHSYQTVALKRMLSKLSESQETAESKSATSKPQRVKKTDSISLQLKSFISEFDPAVAKLIQSCRTTLRKLLPRAVEQVYDNYNFLAIGYCTTERTSDCIVSLACSAKGVSLSFYYGATLTDPDGLLLGSGKQNRFIRLESASTLKNPKVQSLIEQAVAKTKNPFATNGHGYTMIKSVSSKKRPRRLSS
ncbi:MAG: MmcQ/YjbR family DNA-binding protein [Pirellula sp.]